MFLIEFYFVFFFTIFHVSHCERRIVDGEQVTSEKSYVVYLVKAKLSDKKYDAWMCGGALVSREFIITSAACVEDVHFMYAIAGYRKYVNDKQLDQDDCTSKMKKKIVYTCVPVSYEFDYDKIEKWAYIDIALVKVESPYELNNPDFQIMCSYSPTIIPINYDVKRQANEVDAMVLGWGHTEFWRMSIDKENHNQEYLRFGATTLYDKNKCKQEYKDYPDLLATIDKYMICSLEPGHLNDHGVPYTMNQKKNQKLRTGCITQRQRLMGLQGALCKGEIVENPEQVLDLRRHLSLKEKSSNVTKNNSEVAGTMNTTNIDNITNTDEDKINKTGFDKISGYSNRRFTRRNGICQNDHGGPLVTWVGKREVLIGIASVFKITEQNKCIGPFLYTSTVCNGAFIGCVLGDKRANVLRGHNESVSTRKALLCDSHPTVKGFDTIESYVSWQDHPDGPADNERHVSRDGSNGENKRDRYATNIQQESEIDPLKEDEEANDRFSLKLGPPQKRWPHYRKRQESKVQVRQMPPLGKSPLLRNIPPLNWDRPRVNRYPPRVESSAIKRPPPEMEPSMLMSPEMEPPPEIRSPSKIESPRGIRPSPLRELPIIRHPPPIKRPIPEMKPPPIYKPPLENRFLSKNKHSQESRPPAENKRLPERMPPLEERPPPENSPSRQMGLPSKIDPPVRVEAPVMEDPEFAEILDFKSAESTLTFDERISDKKPISNEQAPSPIVSKAQPEILLRPQSPLHG